jgi:hypothetical protein
MSNVSQLKSPYEQRSIWQSLKEQINTGGRNPEWNTVIEVLDDRVPEWSCFVRRITQIGDVVTVVAAITISGVTREGIGTGSAKTEDGIMHAETDALLRAALKFGIGRNNAAQNSGAGEKQEKTASSSADHNVTEFPQASSSFSPEQTAQIENWREEMRHELESVGTKPVEWLARFDTFCQSFEAKREAHQKALERVVLKKREQIKTAIAESGWDINEIEGELSKYEVESGIDNAEPEKISRMWAEYKKAKMI